MDNKNQLVKDLRRFVHMMRTNPKTKHFGAQHVQINLMEFFDIFLLSFEAMIDNAEDIPLSDNDRMKFNHAQISEISSSFNVDVPSNILRVIRLSVVDPYNPSATFQHRMTLCKTKTSQWYLIYAYRLPDCSYFVPTTIRNIDCKEFLENLTRFFCIPETKWNQIIGEQYSRMISPDEIIEPRLIRNDLFNVTFKPVLVIIIEERKYPKRQIEQFLSNDSNLFGISHQ